MNLLTTIAHPDDECMFFLPALTYFRKQHYKVHLLCLSTGTRLLRFHPVYSQIDYKNPHLYSLFSTSTGNADGMGAIRKQELYYSCSLLGIERGSVTIIDDARLPDGMAAVWPVEVVAEHVEAAVKKYSTSTVRCY